MQTEFSFVLDESEWSCHLHSFECHPYAMFKIGDIVQISCNNTLLGPHDAGDYRWAGRVVSIQHNFPGPSTAIVDTRFRCN